MTLPTRLEHVDKVRIATATLNVAIRNATLAGLKVELKTSTSEYMERYPIAVTSVN